MGAAGGIRLPKADTVLGLNAVSEGEPKPPSILFNLYYLYYNREGLPHR